MTIKIPLAKPFLDGSELKAIEETFQTGWLAGQGPKNKQLEEAFAKYTNTKYAICVNNCTAALHLALLSLNIKKRDEVIVPAYTYPATAHAVLYTGANPIFVDIDPKTLNLDPQLIEKHLTERTKAIIPVHLFGQCADMDLILDIAKKHNLKVIEDAACAAGSKYKNRPAGSFGDLACFSFHARKNITSGEGGIITTNNQALAEKIRSLSCFGIPSALSRSEEFSIPQFVDLGYNYKLSDLAAAMLLPQLQRIEESIQKKQQLATYYNKKLENSSLIKTPFCDPHNRHIYQSYIILLDQTINRNQVIVEMKKRGIQTQIGTYALHHQPVYQRTTNCNPYKFPHTELVFNQSLALPLYEELTSEKIDVVVSNLKQVLEEQSNKEQNPQEKNKEEQNEEV